MQKILKVQTCYLYLHDSQGKFLTGYVWKSDLLFLKCITEYAACIRDCFILSRRLFFEEISWQNQKWKWCSLSCRKLKQTLITVLFVLKATNPTMLSEFYLAGKLKVEGAFNSDCLPVSQVVLCSQSIALRFPESQGEMGKLIALIYS